MKINKKALIGMCGGILLADILFVGWALNSLRANETNTVYETKSPAVPVVSAKEKKTEKRKKKKVSWIRKDLDPKKPMVALTFDDGPYTPVTSRILKTAGKYDAKVTFFVVGDRVSTYAKVMKKAYRQGHQIASHTYHHVNLTKLDSAGMLKELDESNTAVKQVIGREMSAIRPPEGAVNDLMRKTFKIPMIYWSIDTEDWRSRDASQILQKAKKIKDGDIVLMHDLYPSTADAVQSLIPRLKKKGFQLVTVDELFYYKKIKAEGGKVYFSGR